MTNSQPAPRAAGFVAVLVIFTILAVFFVGLRLVARIVFLKNGGRDEVAIVCALLCSIGLLVASMKEVQYGVGKHVADVSLPDLELQLQSLWVAIIFYNASLALTKFSIILQYLRVFVGHKMRIACWVAMGIVVVYGVQTFFTSVFACVPISGFWDLGLQARCIDKKFQWFFNASFNIFTDLIVLLLPMPALMEIQLPKKQKIVLMFVFALGGFVCLISILRLHSLYTLSVSSDLTYDNLNAALWSAIEANTGIICASLQTVRPVVARLFPRIFATSRNATKASQLSTFNKQTGANKPLPPLSSNKRSSTRISKGAGDRKHHDLESGKMVIEVNQEISIVSSAKMYPGYKSESGSEEDLIFQKP
ncbi:hypothetical protein BGZ60DRAFT_435500 [Tricladium varicosporioides]|nr:hypothetical protein BGZ60DRAFT_435500 [Hymenoscyphus varicosporioides]